MLYIHNDNVFSAASSSLLEYTVRPVYPVVYLGELSTGAASRCFLTALHQQAVVFATVDPVQDSFSLIPAASAAASGARGDVTHTGSLSGPRPAADAGVVTARATIGTADPSHVITASCIIVFIHWSLTAEEDEAGASDKVTYGALGLPRTQPTWLLST